MYIQGIYFFNSISFRLIAFCKANKKQVVQGMRPTNNKQKVAKEIGFYFFLFCTCANLQTRVQVFVRQCASESLSICVCVFFLEYANFVFRLRQRQATTTTTTRVPQFVIFCSWRCVFYLRKLIYLPIIIIFCFLARSLARQRRHTRLWFVCIYKLYICL